MADGVQRPDGRCRKDGVPCGKKYAVSVWAQSARISWVSIAILSGILMRESS